MKRLERTRRPSEPPIPRFTESICATYHPPVLESNHPIMATRVQPTAHDADNNVGTACGAARNDWRSADADSMSARDTTIPPQMPDIRLQATTRPAFKPDCLSYLREESIYDC